MKAYQLEVLDLFAGPGGWDEGWRQMGRDPSQVLGIEWDAAACATAQAAGYHRLQADIAELDPKMLWQLARMSGGAAPAPLKGLIASPPCQAWSMAGKRGGEHDRAACHDLADAMASGADQLEGMDWADERSALVCQPIRWARELRPEWIALEEVPAVLGLWEHFATILQGWGYHTWTGVLNAEAYGVPQTRRRAFLGASLKGPVAVPVPTHSRYYQREPARMDDGVVPWVSMHTALAEHTPPGWGFTQRPAYTLMAGANGKGSGAEWGGAGVRSAMYAADLEAREWLRMSNHKNAAIRHQTAPAPTMMFGHAACDARWVPKGVDPQPGVALTAATRPADAIRVSVAESAVLQTFPADYPWSGTQTKQYEQVSNAVPPRLAAAVLASVIPT